MIKFVSTKKLNLSHDTMKALKLLHKMLEKTCPTIHKTRLNALMAGVSSGVTEHQISVTSLGRNLRDFSNTSTKHDIKRMDRLIGNDKLHQDRSKIYAMMTKYLIGQENHPLLIVDWSPIEGQSLFQLLRVSLPKGGRSLTLYEQCYPESWLNNNDAHNALLDELERLLPAGCCPVLISDAIYRIPWFKSVESKGWYWLGRVRGNIHLSVDGEQWHSCRHYMQSANSRATSLGQLYYSKVSRFTCQGYLYRKASKKRQKLKKRGGKSHCGTSLYQERKSNEPWLLVSNLPKHKITPKKIVKIYSTRMQIEESFRDSKNCYFGIGLSIANSTSAERYDNLLLIAALAQFLLWCLGKAAYEKGYQKLLQANTIINRHVLSFIYMAKQIVNDKRYKISLAELKNVFKQLNQEVISLDSI